MTGAGRSRWVLVLLVLFVLIQSLLFGLSLTFAELSEIQDWDEDTIQTLMGAMEALGMLSVVLLAECMQRVADQLGCGAVGVVGVVLLFVLLGTRMLFSPHGALSAFVAAAVATLYAFELRRYEIDGWLRSSEVSE